MDRLAALKYGQVIRIHNYTEIDSQSGLLISKGFTDPHVYFMYVKQLELINNYRDSLFQILPRGTFDIHDEFLKSVDGTALMPRMRTEADQYHLIIQNRMNEDILFGAEVIFKHVDSQEYLFGSYNCSEFSTDAFKLKLVSELSSQTVFRLTPYQTYQKDGQTIYINEPLILTHEKSLCRVDFVDCCIFLDREVNTTELQNDQFRPMIKKATNKRVEAVIGLNSQSQWTFKLHNDQGCIKPYDLCFFQYTLNNSYLSVQNYLITLKQFKDKECVPLDAVWEVQQHKDMYVLRHQLSGKVIDHQGRLGDYSEHEFELLQLQPAKSGVEQISYNNCLQILAGQSELQQTTNVGKRSVIRRDSTYSSVDMYYKQLNQEDWNFIQHQLQFKHTKSLHGFHLKKVSANKKRDLLLICSSHEILQQFCEVLRLPIKQIENIFNELILTEVSIVLQQLIGYLTDSDYNEHTDQLPIKSRQIYMKDLQITEIIMQIIYLISMKNDLDRIYKYKKSERQKLRQIYKSSYLLIEKMTKNNPSVKLYISQWLELFLHQAMSIDDIQVQNSLSELLDDNYYAINQFITKLTLQRLVKLISQRTPHEKYLRIFSCIVVCNGKAIINNQIHILNMFYLSQTQITSQFKFQFKIENNTPYILSHVSKHDIKWRQLQQFYIDSEKADDFQSWNYFLAYLTLLSDICLNRNKFGKRYVQDNLPLDILCSLLEDEDAKQINAIEPILKLIHTAYIDCQHYTPIRRIARVREWHTIEQKNDILKTHAEASLQPANCDLKRVMKFIEKYLEDFEYFQVKQRTSNQNLYTVLSVFKTTLRLGFWKSIVELQVILPNLLKIASCSRDIVEYELEEGQDLQGQDSLLSSGKNMGSISKGFQLLYNKSKVNYTKLNSDNLIVMNCKALSCEIMDIIIDMETNVRVSKSTQMLKKLFTDLQANELLETSPLQERTLQSQSNVFNIEYWISVFKELIESRTIFTNVNSDQYIIEVLLAELTLFDNSNLIRYSLQLLNRVYGQRRELVYNFGKILIVATGFTFTLSVDSRVTRTKLISLNDRNIYQATLENQKDFNIFLWRESDNFKESGVIQDLNWLTECLKKGKEVKREELSIQYEALYPENKVRQIYTEREENHKLHQSLIKCQDLHENILCFIENAVDIKDNLLLMKLLNSCYNFLMMIIWGHQENKMDFIKTVEIAMKHIPYNVGCIEYLRELFANNKNLLFNEIHIVNVSELVIKSCDGLDMDKYYKSSLLEFLRILVTHNNKTIKFNQLQIMAFLQERKYNNIQQIFSDPRSLYGGFDDLIVKYQDDYQISLNSLEDLLISPQLTYLFNYFQLLSLLIEDQNEINSGKCKQMHPHSKLLQLYQKSGQCWPLKRYLRAYINRLYYTSYDYGGLTQQLIEIDIENLIQDLNDIVDLMTSGIQVGKIKLKNPTRYTYLMSYIYLTLEENLITLNTIMNRQKFLEDLEDTLYQNFMVQKFKLHLELLEIGSLLSKVQQIWPDSKFIQNFTQILIMVFRSIYKTFDLSLLIIRDSLRNSIPLKAVTIETSIRHTVFRNNQLISDESTTSDATVDPASLLNQNLNQLVPEEGYLDDPDNVTNLKEVFINQVFAQTTQDYKRTLTVDLFQVNRQVEDSIIMDKNEQLNQIHRKLLNLFAHSNQFQQFIEEEFYQVCEKLNTIDQEGIRLNQKYFQNVPVITLKEFIQNIIQLNLNFPDSLNEELRVFFLKLLARIITEKNLNNKEQMLGIDYWSPEYWSDYKEPIESAQNFLEGCGAAELICSLLQKPGLESRLMLTNELLIFGVAFLLGGNTKCQNSILSKMKMDVSNAILHNLTIVIRKIGRVAYNNYKIRKTKYQDNQSFRVTMVDNYDYFDEVTQTMQRINQIETDDQRDIAEKKSYITLLNRAFRFLQLLCENNNIAMKNFIRQQTDADQSVKIGTINLIEFATTQIRIFFRIINNQLLDIPLFILDFLIEVIQVPCLENQLTLCKTTFFEDGCYLLQFLGLKEHLIQRKLYSVDEQVKVQQIYNKILVAIMSVLEGNDDRIQEDLQNKLEPKFLFEIMTQTLQHLKVKESKDMVVLLDQQKSLYSDEIVKILNVIIIQEKLQEKLINPKWQQESLKLDDPNLCMILDVLKQKIIKIEIIYQEKQQTILFPSHPLFTFLSGQTKDKIMFQISRDTQREKIQGLLKYKDVIFNELEYNHQLSEWKVPVTNASIQRLSQISAILSILVNTVMILSYNMDVKNQMATLVATFWEQVIINSLEFLQLLTALIYYVFYLISRIPLCLKQDEIKLLSQHVIEQPILIQDGEDEFNVRWSRIKLAKRKRDITYEIAKLTSALIKQASYYIHSRVLPTCLNLYYRIMYIFELVYFIVRNEDDFARLSIYVLCAVLGTFFKSYFFSLHLFDLFSRLSLLKNVLQAISYNAKQLFVVALLGILFMYVFSFTTFDSYVDEIYKEDVPDEHCETLVTCMITLITSGVIGTSMSKWDFIKFLYDSVYFVFFALLFTNIVSGIMIDTFAELRDARQKIEDDKKNMCFICGLERVQLEKNQEVFETHVRDKHFLWNYIFYMYSLSKKDSTEYTGLEYAISDMINKESIQWFPIVTDSESNDLEERISRMEEEFPKQMNQILSQIRALVE